MATPGTVYLVGAGPGDPGLLTVRGAELLERCDVIIYDGLVGDALLERIRPDALAIYAGKKRTGVRGPLSQKAICDLIVLHAQDGRSVVRLKGGDPLVFGGAAEELEALVAAGIHFEIVAGVSALTGAAAAGGVTITRRSIASSVAFATGHAAGEDLAESDFESLAKADTAVLFMAVRSLRRCIERLIANGREPSDPAMVIARGSQAAQRELRAPLCELADAAENTDIRPPALVVVGAVAAADKAFEWRKVRPLSGHSVFIGRPRAGDHFAAAVAELGGEPLVAPLTEVVAADGEERRKAMLAVSQLETESYDWVVFSSARAVSFFFAALRELDLDIRSLAGTKIACVGASTAAALAARSLHVDLVPEVRTSDGMAHELVARGPFDRALIVRASGGRPDAEVVLGAHGTAAVAPLYRSQTAGESAAIIRARYRFGEGTVSAAAFFAPSQVSAFFELFDAPAAALAGVRAIAAIGPTTAAALSGRGVPCNVIAKRADSVALAGDLATFLGS